MSSSPALITSRSTLMHASLAYHSDELRTIDSIISETSIFAPRSSVRLAIPPEVLLLIRSHLFLNITNTLITRSTSALQRYETSLCHLLCSECIEYNQEIYGQDIWQWERFSGACGCGDIQVVRPRIFAMGIAAACLRSSPTSSPAPNPKQFMDRHHWLEYYLSRKSVKVQKLLKASGDSSAIIWDVVSDVLEDFGCEIIRVGGCGWRLICEGKGQQVLVGLQSSTENTFDDRTMMVKDGWETRTTLNRVEKGLGLSLEYQGSLEDSSPLSTSLSIRSSLRSHTGPTCTFPHLPSQSPLISAVHLLHNATVALAACLAFPLAFLTLLATTVCYYSAPNALRII